MQQVGASRTVIGQNRVAFSQHSAAGLVAHVYESGVETRGKPLCVAETDHSDAPRREHSGGGPKRDIEAVGPHPWREGVYAGSISSTLPEIARPT